MHTGHRCLCTLCTRELHTDLVVEAAVEEAQHAAPYRRRRLNLHTDARGTREREDGRDEEVVEGMEKEGGERGMSKKTSDTYTAHRQTLKCDDL